MNFIADIWQNELYMTSRTFIANSVDYNKSNWMIIF